MNNENTYEFIQLSVSGFSMRAVIGETNGIISNQIKYCFLWRGENQSTLRKISRSRVENQRTQPIHANESVSRARPTLVGNECSLHAVRHPCSLCESAKAKRNVLCEVTIIVV